MAESKQTEKSIKTGIIKGLSKRDEVLVWVNTNGLAVYDNANGGSFTVPYGLCRGASDLIGIRKLTITPEMVGKEIGQFVAIEVKTPQGRATEEQLTFINLIRQYGGVAGIARNDTDAITILDKHKYEEQ